MTVPWNETDHAALIEMRNALDAMPRRRLLYHLVDGYGGEGCAIGCLARVRGLLSPGWLREFTSWPEKLGISADLFGAITSENDKNPNRETCEDRWDRMRQWVAVQIAGSGA